VQGGSWLDRRCSIANTRPDDLCLLRWDEAPLSVAVRRGHTGVAKALLTHAVAVARVNSRDKEGRTALWHACCRDLSDLVKALLEVGGLSHPSAVKIECECVVEGFTPNTPS
jgi:hypothetical protein